MEDLMNWKVGNLTGKARCSIRRSGWGRTGCRSVGSTWWFNWFGDWLTSEQMDGRGGQTGW